MLSRCALLCLAAACTGVITSPPPVVTPLAPPPAPECKDELAIGRTGLRRLSALEYDLTVERVLGDTSRPSQLFPPEAAAAGFDHVTDVQSVSPLHGVRYEEAADRLARALWSREYDLGFTRRFEAEQNVLDGGYDVVRAISYADLTSNGARVFYDAYRIYVLTHFDVAGDYEVGFEAWSLTFPDGGQGLSDGGFRPVLWRLQLDNQAPFYTARVSGTAAQHTLHRGTVRVETPGIHRLDLVAADPLNLPVCNPDAGVTVDCEPGDPELGRVDALWLTRASTRVPQAEVHVRSCELTSGDACVRSTLEGLCRRLWRRPATPEELDRLMALFTAAQGAGDPLGDAFTQGVTALLLSPHFLFQVQLDPDLVSTAPHPLTSHELASRLSYFLTRGPPDDELAARADDGTLLDPAVLEAQALRLLADPSSAVMVRSLGTQLLSNRDLAATTPSPTLFPNFTPALKVSMASEAELLFTTVFNDRRPVTELGDARYTFVDDTLAAHYGLPLPGSAVPMRVTLATDQRGGVLGLGSLLTLTSTPTRPSQVKRGVWVLGHLMCDEPPPPPDNIPALLEAQPGAEALAAHTANPVCTACHKVIDPIGLALDRYDADGSHRDADRLGRALPAVGTLPDGAKVEGLSGLRTYLKADPRFEACMAEHLMVYALARAPTHDDACIAKRLPGLAGGVGQATFHELVRALVRSEVFRSRQAEGLVGP